MEKSKTNMDSLQNDRLMTEPIDQPFGKLRATLNKAVHICQDFVNPNVVTDGTDDYINTTTPSVTEEIQPMISVTDQSNDYINTNEASVTEQIQQTIGVTDQTDDYINTITPSVTDENRENIIDICNWIQESVGKDLKVLRDFQQCFVPVLANIPNGKRLVMKFLSETTKLWLFEQSPEIYHWFFV